jgi:hypothetical protein
MYPDNIAEWAQEQINKTTIIENKNKNANLTNKTESEMENNLQKDKKIEPEKEPINCQIRMQSRKVSKLIHK